MKKNIVLSILIVIFTILLFGCLTSSKTTDNSVILSKEVKNILLDNVFEVIVNKAEDKTLVYEKELAWDKIDYTYRTDEYESIGTAFLYPEKIMGESQVFVTNMHVLYYLYRDTKQFKDYYIRNQKDKHVYGIDKILAFGDPDYRDIVFFTIDKELNIDKRLPGIRNDIRINEYVAAVGNAYGNGIVERMGTITSTQKEGKNGEWDWIITSANVSPGNSGGPLIDLNGNLLGLVKAKQKDEASYNYSLPASQFKKCQNKYFVDANLVLYGIQTKDRIKTDFDIKTPDTIENIRKAIHKKEIDLYKKEFDVFLDENKDKLFPQADKSLDLLYAGGWRNTYFPCLIAEDKNNNWFCFLPADDKRANVKLDKDGYLERYEAGYLTTFRFKIPEDIELGNFLNDDKLFLKSFLKGFPHHRTFAGEEIKILDVKSSCEKKEIKDVYGRKWFFDRWFVDVGDQYLYVIYTVDPLGVKGFSKIVAVNNTETFECDMNEMLNRVEISHYGTLKDWKRFLSLKKYIPDMLKNFSLEYEVDKYAKIGYKNFEYELNNDLLNITDDSDICVNFYHKVDNDKVTMEIKRIAFGEDEKNGNGFYLMKEVKPIESVSNDYHSYWEKKCYRKSPYDKKISIDQGKTYIKDLANKYASIEGDKLVDEDYFYWVEFSFEGAKEQEEMEAKLDGFNENLKILE